jgi:hypothetical protein
MSFYVDFCPTCGVGVENLESHRCDQKKLDAIDRAMKQESVQPMLGRPNRTTRLSHGFLMSSLAGDCDYSD